MNYKQSEGYCLMQYLCERCEKSEILWNSRDGVTPFIIGCKCGDIMKHVNWEKDTCIPEFKPKKGMRIFVDLTLEKHMEFKKKMIEKYWNRGEAPMSKMFKSKEDAIDYYANQFNPKRGEPDIITVL